MKCEFCGWHGSVEGRPWRSLLPEAYTRWGEKLDRKRTGRLFVLRVEFLSESGSNFEVLSLLGAGATMNGRGIAELASRPDEATLERIRKLKSVKSADLV